MNDTTTNDAAMPVIRGARFFMAHTPGLLRHGSKPARDIAADPRVDSAIEGALRGYEAALAYPPNRVMLGALHPDALNELPRPWFEAEFEGKGESSGAERRGPHGELMPEAEFYGLLKICDAAGLVSLEPAFAAEAREALAVHPLMGEADLAALDGAGSEAGPPQGGAGATDDGGEFAELPLLLRGGRRAGAIRADHATDETLAAPVLLENLACKATAVMALRALLKQEGIDPREVGYLLNSGEEAVGDRYQRGGGNLAKAVAEMCGCTEATGVDVKGFCCGPVHAVAIAGALVRAGMYRHVAVVGGCSLAKLGMKYQGHLKIGQPVLEDVLAGVALLVSGDDGVSPLLRLDALGRHTVAAGSSQQAILEALVAQPLERLGLRFGDVDKYATELQNPELTEPAGSGDVPLLNYRAIAGLAALRKEIDPAELPAFVARHGMPGFSPTQGHIASALPFLGHALDGLRSGSLRRVMFLAKGSLFLGRMTQLSDGMSFILERNG